MMRTILTALAVTVALPMAAQDFNWTGQLDAGDVVEIRGLNGAIDAVAAGGNTVRVTAEKRARRGDASAVQVVAVPHDGGVLICAVYPDNDPEEVCRVDGRRGEHNSHNNDTQVDFRVEVPAGVRLVARTVNGTVDARGLSSDVEASTVNGDVTVSTSGLAEASTVNGSLRARMGRADWDGSASFSTVNGSITLELPASFSAEVSIETVNGGIESDFPITISGRWGPRRARGTIGEGGRDLRLRTVNGGIELRRG